LHISSWGDDGPRGNQVVEEADPETKIQAYLKQPQPVEARSNLDGTCLVSGLVKTKERTDQTIFDLLNLEDSAFKFDKIVAFVDDVKFAKKRLLSRHARYTGLLDRLDFSEAIAAGALPTVEQLDGVKSWVAVVSGGEGVDIVSELTQISGTAKAATSIENVAVLVTDATSLDEAAAKAAVESFASDSFSFTVIATGPINDKVEGSMPYMISELGTANGTVSAEQSFSRDEGLRMITTALALESGKNKAMTFTEVTDVNQTETKLVRGLRECGFTRPQEIEHMISKGPEAYMKAIEEFRTRVPKALPQDQWWAAEQEKLEAKEREKQKTADKDMAEKKKKEIDDIAREWAKREYFRKCMAGDMPYSEDEYIKSVWDRALFEGDLKYRMLHGQATDERRELAEFKKKQEKKKQVMLERAKAAMADLLDEDDDDDEE